MLKRCRRLRADRLKKRNVGGVEMPLALVEDFEHSHDRAVALAQRHADQCPGAVAGVLIERELNLESV